MITKPMLMLSIDNVFMSVKDLKEVSLYSSIDMTLPELTFKIEDNGGTHAALMEIYVGAIVAVQVIDFNDNLNDDAKSGYPYMQFIVTKILDGFEHNDDTLSGFLQVWCKPAWYMFGTYQGHAYPPMKLSELIKKVCQDANGSAKLKVEDENFANSSDPGNVPRFKTGESDIDFIEQKLLPYTNIDDSNVFFFVDWFNKPHLTSFARLISQTEKVLLIPPQMISSSVEKTVTKISEQKGINEVYSWGSIKLTVGDENIRNAFATLKEQVTFENNETGKVYIANQQPKAKLGKDSSPNYNAKMPINAISMEYISATGSKTFPNRLLPDALALARNDDNNVIDFMQIEVSVNGIVDKVAAGDTAFLLPPLRLNKDENATDEEKKKKIHWITGKWLIKAIQVSQTDGKTENATSLLELVRPTMQFSSEQTTIANPAYFYTVD